MSTFEKRITLSENTPSALYEITVNDGGYDGGSSFTINVSTESMGFSANELETAIQAFAESLGSIGNFTLTSTKKFGVSATTL